MRTHINNKVYDTSTAKKVLLVANEYTKSDLRYQELGIYKKSTGEYFLYQYTCERGIITPLSYQKAKEFVSLYGTPEEYEKEFSIPDSQGVTSVRFDLPLDVKRKLDMVASSRGVSKTQCLIDIIRSV